MAAEGYRVTCWVTIGEVIFWSFLGVLYNIHLLGGGQGGRTLSLILIQAWLDPLGTPVLPDQSPHLMTSHGQKKTTKLK